MEKIYKGHKITLDEATGTFRVFVNGLMKKTASLQSAINVIDREAVTDFTPQEVVVIDEDGYSPCVYTAKKVMLVKYTEEKGYRGQMQRYFLTQDGDKIRIGRRTELYPVSALKQITQICKERTEQEKIASMAEKKSGQLGKKLENMRTINPDPRPELAEY